VADIEVDLEGPRAVVLAVGEESGHQHVLKGVEFQSGGRRLIQVGDNAQMVVAPETMAWRHAPIDVPPGTYEVIIEREYVAPAVERRVED